MPLTKIRYRILWSVALILMGFLFAATSLQAETIHVIIAADTDPERANPAVAQATQQDKDGFERIFRENVPESQLAIHSIPIEKVWSADILRIVDELVITPGEDTVVFFYSGHGAYDSTKKQQFFQLAADPPTPEKSDLYRNDVLDRIIAKNPRLTVMLSDCCNMPAPPKIALSTRSARWVSRSPSSISPLFNTLFIKVKGVVDVTSSQLGEYSCVNKKTGGSFFTEALVDLLNTDKDNDGLIWKEFVDKLSSNVQNAFSVVYPNGLKTSKASEPPQHKQTVFVYRLPGMSATRLYGKEDDESSTPLPPPPPAPRQGPRFGVRAIAEKSGGLRVTELISDSPGEKAGFDIGDVLMEINGKPINTEQEYSDAVDESPKQMQLKMKNVRNGQIITPTIELGW